MCELKRRYIRENRYVPCVCGCLTPRLGLKVIKALLTLVTTAYVELHEAALMLSVQACYHIHLTAKNQALPPLLLLLPLVVFHFFPLVSFNFLLSSSTCITHAMIHQVHVYLFTSFVFCTDYQLFDE